MESPPPPPVRVFRNDWSALRPPRLGAWTPRLGVSVVIPFLGGRADLERTLAGLATQTYPAGLLEVVVVDARPDRHGSPPALPTTRTDGCRVVPLPPGRGGVGAARAYGAHVSTGEILCWLDADLVVDRDHVEAHARWQHIHGDAVTLGRIHRVAAPLGRHADVAGLARSGGLARVLGSDVEHTWRERLLDRTDLLRDADHLGFGAYVGAAAALTRELYEEVGGLDPALDAGQDTELGYRLWQAGAVLVPESRATAWHTATTPAARRARTRPPSARCRTEVLADAMPQPRTHRLGRADPHPVPLVLACVDVAGQRLEQVRACVDRLLGGSESDLAVTLLAPWNDTGDGAAPEPDTLLELRLIQAHYLGNPRVTFTTAAPQPPLPTPYLLEVPVTVGLGGRTVATLLARADRARAGLVEMAAPNGGGTVRLWRTRALSRAVRVCEPGESRADVVAQVHGRYRLRGGPGYLCDLRDAVTVVVPGVATPRRTPADPPAFATPPGREWPRPGLPRRVRRALRAWVSRLRSGRGRPVRASRG